MTLKNDTTVLKSPREDDWGKEENYWQNARLSKFANKLCKY